MHRNHPDCCVLTTECQSETIIRSFHIRLEFLIYTLRVFWKTLSPSNHASFFYVSCHQFHDNSGETHSSDVLSTFSHPFCKDAEHCELEVNADFLTFSKVSQNIQGIYWYSSSEQQWYSFHNFRLESMFSSYGSNGQYFN